jgi:hypothetical protein
MPVNKSKVKEYQREYHHRNAEKLVTYLADWRSKNQKKVRELAWKRYGIKFTIEEYNTLLDEQNHCCAICRRHVSELTKALSLDHNHETGKTRGLLCHRCNLGIGKFEDDPEILQAATDYLKSYTE